MKSFLDKIKAMKGGIWVMVLMVCAVSCLLLPSGRENASGMTEEEKRISATLSQIAGAGETRVSIYYAQETSAFGGSGRTPVGAVIVAQGAGDVGVRLKLKRAAETLLGLPENAVEVFRREEKP